MRPMPISDFLTQTCLLLRRDPAGSQDVYGNELEGEATATGDCSLQQQQRAEGGDGLSDTRWLLVLPAGTVIDTGDAVKVDGRRYELVGEPWPVTDPRTQTVSHVECTVRRAAGSGDTS